MGGGGGGGWEVSTDGESNNIKYIYSLDKKYANLITDIFIGSKLILDIHTTITKITIAVSWRLLLT